MDLYIYHFFNVTNHWYMLSSNLRQKKNVIQVFYLNCSSMGSKQPNIKSLYNLTVSLQILIFVGGSKYWILYLHPFSKINIRCMKYFKITFHNILYSRENACKKKCNCSPIIIPLQDYRKFTTRIRLCSLIQVLSNFALKECCRHVFC